LTRCCSWRRDPFVVLTNEAGSLLPSCSSVLPIFLREVTYKYRISTASGVSVFVPRANVRRTAVLWYLLSKRTSSRRASRNCKHAGSVDWLWSAKTKFIHHGRAAAATAVVRRADCRCPCPNMGWGKWLKSTDNSVAISAGYVIPLLLALLLR